MRLVHDLGKFIELRDAALELPLWRYVYGGKPKPFFHPLCTPAGHCLTLFEPHDHVWHRGLWFTIKFINGENFWEERPPFGVQVTIAPPTVAPDGEALLVSSRQSWKRPHDAGEVFDESRRFTYRPIDDQCYAIDFETTLTPLSELLLDRTPFTTWGGYGGLTFRGNRNWMKSRLLFADGTTSDRPTPKISEWCDLSGLLDGGLQQSGGVAIFDHPTNPRHPTPWYGGTGPGHYFNAAFLFNEPMRLSAGQVLRFNYRVLVHDGIWERDRLHVAYERWLADSAACSEG